MIEYNMALASASSNTKPVGMCTPPYLLPSWTLLKPSLCLYRQAFRDNDSCGVVITVYAIVEEPLVHKGSNSVIHRHTIVTLSCYSCELDVYPNHGTEWLAMLVATQKNGKTLLLKSKWRDLVLPRVPNYKQPNNVNTPLPGVQSMIDACWSGKFTQLTMEVL